MLTSVYRFLIITLIISQSVLQCAGESFKALKSVETVTDLRAHSNVPLSSLECYCKVGKWLERMVICLKDENQ